MRTGAKEGGLEDGEHIERQQFQRLGQDQLRRGRARRGEGLPRAMRRWSLEEVVRA
jgi:hypothetical protein